MDVAFFSKCSLFASPDEVCMPTYNCFDHKAVKFLLECSNCEEKPIIEKFRIYGSADYSAKIELIEQIDFIPKCYTDINEICEEKYDFFDKRVEAHVPRRTRHPQSPLFLWITSNTLNLLRKRRSQKRLLLMKTTTYRKMQVANCRTR